MAIFLVVATAPLAAPQQPTAPVTRTEIEAGRCTTFYSSGAVRDHGPIDDNRRRDGEWVTYWPNGRIAATGRYFEGDRRGEWHLRDEYGRVCRRVTYGDQERYSNDVSTDRWVLRREDLRASVVGLETFGDVLDRYANAIATGAPREERARIAARLRDVRSECFYLAIELARASAAATRSHWLELCAAMQLPDAFPEAEVFRWLDDPASRPGAHALLLARSERARRSWAPAIASNGVLSGTAYAALPELRTRLEQGVESVYRIANVNGARYRGSAPFLAQLTHPDAGMRLEALASLPSQTVYGTELEQQLIAAAARMLDDPHPVVRRAAANLVAYRNHPTDSERNVEIVGLERLATSAEPALRTLAATHLTKLGRSAESERIWHDLATNHREFMDRHNGWRQWAQARPDSKKLREHVCRDWHGKRRLRHLLSRVAPNSRECFEFALAELSAGSSSIAATIANQNPEFMTRLRTAFESGELSQDQRIQLFRDRPELIAAVTGKPIVTAVAKAYGKDMLWAVPAARRFGLTLTAKRWREVLRKSELTLRVARDLAHTRMPKDFDPKGLRLSDRIAATWADGNPDRIARLVERWLRGNGSGCGALMALDLRLTDYEPRILKRWRRWPQGTSLSDRGRLRRLAPRAHAAWLVGQLTTPPSGIVCPPHPPPDPRHLLAPITPPILDALAHRILDWKVGRSQQALQLAFAIGADAQPLVCRIEACRSQLCSESLRMVPATIASISPDDVTRVVLPLLHHSDDHVARVALAGAIHRTPWTFQPSAKVARVPADPAFAVTVAEHLVAGHVPSTAWFRHLESCGHALPILRQGLQGHPDSSGIAAALGDLGPKARAAVPELMAALPVNSNAAAALAAILPRDELWQHLVPELATAHAGTVAAVLRANPTDETWTSEALEDIAKAHPKPARTAAAKLLALSPSESEFADAVRREQFDAREDSRASRLTAKEIPRQHLGRLWPELDPARRIRFLRLLHPSREELPLPPLLQSAVTDYFTTRARRGFELGRLTQWAPLHPEVVSRSYALLEPWNRTHPRRGDLLAWHMQSILGHWRSSRPEYQAKAREILRTFPDATLHAAVRLTNDPTRSAIPHHRRATWSRIEILRLFADLAVPSGARLCRWHFSDPDPTVRRQALTTLLASTNDRKVIRNLLELATRNAALESVFGPREQLPPICYECLPTPASRAERLATARQVLLAKSRWSDDRSLPQTQLTPELALELLPEISSRLRMLYVEEAPGLLRSLRQLGPAARTTLPAVENLLGIPAIHVDARRTMRILRGEGPIEPRHEWLDRGPSGGLLRLPTRR
ncbi:MAG: hypothetical protein NXI31_19710 [bacterium]|nr:hypothetical protein [bacterium]